MRRRKEENIPGLKIQTEYIKLGQALKLAGLVGSGTDAKYVIAEGMVQVNGETELRRGRKLIAGDEVLFQGERFRIET